MPGKKAAALPEDYLLEDVARATQLPPSSSAHEQLASVPRKANKKTLHQYHTAGNRGVQAAPFWPSLHKLSADTCLQYVVQALKKIMREASCALRQHVVTSAFTVF